MYEANARLTGGTATLSPSGLQHIAESYERLAGRPLQPRRTELSGLAERLRALAGVLS